MAKLIVPLLLKHGKVLRGYLGLQVRTVPIQRVTQLQLELAHKTAVEVMHVEPNGPADQAGVQEEDHILAIADEPVASVDDLHRLLTQLPIEVPATITLLRGQRRLDRMILPQEYPHPAPTA
jgi:S1-C subfamily serine protease